MVFTGFNAALPAAGLHETSVVRVIGLAFLRHQSHACVVTGTPRQRSVFPMSDPQPLFGRFTDWPESESQPRDADDWLCEAEEALSDAQRCTEYRQRLAAIDRAMGCIEKARVLVA